MKKRIPVLLFHNIAQKPKDRWTLSAEHFEALLVYLRRRKFETVFCNYVASQPAYRPRRIALTFDDGHQSIYHIAFPLLKKYGFTATIFITTDFIGKKIDADHLALTDAQIREMSAAGMEIGAHALSHVDMRKLGRRAKMEQIIVSTRILEEITGKVVDTFSYPYSGHDDYMQKLLQESGFRAAYTVFKGKNNVSFDRFAYDRLEISNVKHPFRQLEFWLKTSGLYWV